MKKVFLYLFVLLLSSNASFAVELPSVMKQTMAQDPISMPGMLNLLVSMIIVIALIYATGWIYAKLNIINRDKLKKIVSKNADSHRFNILQSMPLGQQRYLYSIEMNGKVMLIASTPSHINLLKEFDKSDDISLSKIEIKNEEETVDNTKVEKQAELNRSLHSLNFDELYKKYKK